MREEYIYMDCKIRLSDKAMSSLMYALVITKSIFTDSYGVGIYEYSRGQNKFNNVEFRIYIHPDKIKDFEVYSGVKLTIPIKFSINNI